MIRTNFIALLTLLAVSSVSTAHANVVGIKQGAPKNISAGQAVKPVSVKPGHTVVKKTGKHSNTVHRKQGGSKTVKHSSVNAK